jgi:phage-related protein
MAGDFNLGTASGRIVVDGSAAELGFAVAQTAAGAFFDVVKQRVNEVQQFGRRLAAVGVAGVAGFGLAINTAANFEQQMSGVKAVAGATEDQFESLRKKAMQLGADTSFSATEAGLAIEELAKAGISVEQILSGAADATVALAAAGGVDLPQAATIAANAMNQFGLSGEKVGAVADILAGVANTSAADVSSLGQSLSQAGAVANLAGLSFRDTAIALGEMADAGIQGSDAGTSLKTMLNNLIPSTKIQKDEFKKLGLLTYDLAAGNDALTKSGLSTARSQGELFDIAQQYVAEQEGLTAGTGDSIKATDAWLKSVGALNNEFFDAKGNVKDLGGIQDALGKSMRGLTREQKLQSLQLLFGADAMRASAILSLEGKKGYDEFNAAVSKTKAADVAKTRLDNLKGAQEALSGSLETARIIIGSVFIPILTAMVRALTAVVNAFNSLPKGIQVAIGVLGLLFASGSLLIGLLLAFLPVIASFVAHLLLMRAIKGIASAFRLFFATLKAGQGVMAAQNVMMARMGLTARATGGRILFLTKVLKGLRAAWLFATGPIGLAIAAVLVFIALGVLLYKKWEPFRNLVDKIGAAIKSGLLSAFQAVQPLIQKAVAMFQQFGDYIVGTLLPVIKQIGEQLAGKAMAGFNEIKDAVSKDLIPAFKQFVGVVQSTVVPAAQQIGAALKPIVPVVLKIYSVIIGLLLKAWLAFGKVLISFVIPILLKIVGFLLGVVIGAIVDLVTGIIQAVTGIIKIFTGLIDFVAGVFTGDWGRAWDGVKNIFSGIIDLIVGLVKVWFSIGILKAVGLGFRALLALVRGGWALIVALFRASGNLLINIIKLPFVLIGRLIMMSFRTWLNIVRSGAAGMRTVFSAGINAIRSIVARVFAAIVALIRGEIQLAVNLLKSAWGLARDLTASAWNAIVRAVSTGIGKVVGKVQELPGMVSSGLGNLLTTLAQAGRDLMQGFINGIGDMASAVAGKARDIVQGAVGAVAGALHLGSPSKLFRQYGNWTIQGQIIGMEDEERNLISTAGNMAKSMIGTYSKALGGMDPKLIATVHSSPAAVAGSTKAVTPRVRPKGNKAATMRLVRGELRIDGSGRAFIKGLAQEVYDGESDFEDAHDRMGKR